MLTVLSVTLQYILTLKKPVRSKVSSNFTPFFEKVFKVSPTPRPWVMRGLKKCYMNIIFDFDGTLYSKKGFAFPLIMRNLFSLRYLFAERRARKELHGCYFGDESGFYEHFFHRAAEISGLSAERFARWYQGKYMASLLGVLKRHFTAYPDVNRLAKICTEKSIRLFVYSDYSLTEERMEAIGVNKENFIAVSDAPAYGGLKPSKTAFEKFMDANDILPEESVFVGDSDECDRALAMSIGLRYISIPNEGWKSLEKIIIKVNLHSKRHP